MNFHTFPSEFLQSLYTIPREFLVSFVLKSHQNKQFHYYKNDHHNLSDNQNF